MTFSQSVLGDLEERQEKELEFDWWLIIGVLLVITILGIVGYLMVDPIILGNVVGM